MSETRLWVLHALLRMRGVHNAHRLVLGLLWRAAQTAGKLNPRSASIIGAFRDTARHQ